MALDFTHSSEQFLASLDAEIDRLQEIRKQIAAALGTEAKAPAADQPKRRGMSEEGRRKIAEAQKARWAKQKSTSTAAKRTPGKKASAKKAPSKKTVFKKSAAKQPSAKVAPIA